MQLDIGENWKYINLNFCYSSSRIVQLKIPPTEKLHLSLLKTAEIRGSALLFEDWNNMADERQTCGSKDGHVVWDNQSALVSLR